MLDERADLSSDLLEELGIPPFSQRIPWIGGDLQTLRDSFRQDISPSDVGKEIEISVPSLPNKNSSPGHLLGLLDLPSESQRRKGIVLMLHGLGGSSRRLGLRRMAFFLLSQGFVVFRLNLRGSQPGRHLAPGTYAAECTSDLRPVLHLLRQFCESLANKVECRRRPLPLFGVGISLGGTILLNACLQEKYSFKSDYPVLDGLACTSSPLDLESCSACIERPRNKLYQAWLLNRLVRQTYADPFFMNESERDFLEEAIKNRLSGVSIRDFDSYITAPRWGYQDVDAYYSQASPLKTILQNKKVLPPTLFLQSLDDPWVPFEGAQKLHDNLNGAQESKSHVVLTNYGGHNGFHGRDGCWGDYLVERWLTKLSLNL